MAQSSNNNMLIVVLISKKIYNRIQSSSKKEGDRMNNLFLFGSLVLILGAFVGYFLLIIFGNIKVTDDNGFDITKDIISEYDSINVIESKGYFTIYNIKRKVIRLSSKCYYGNKISDISLSLVEAGISIVDNNKNKYIQVLKKIFPNLKVLYIFSILSLIINYLTYTISDAKVSLIIIGMFSVISYMLIDIKSDASMWVASNVYKLKNISKKNEIIISNYINRLLLFDKLIFLGQLVMLIRCIFIMMN